MSAVLVQTTVVQQIVRQKMLEQGISGNALAKKAGIPSSSLKNILQGKVESPRAQTLHALARALHCTVEELMFPSAEDAYSSEEVSVLDAPIIDLKKDENFDVQLFTQAVQAVSDISEERNYTLGCMQANRFAECAYDYALSATRNENRPTHIDRAFICWLMEREKARNPRAFLRKNPWKNTAQPDAVPSVDISASPTLES